jgi:anti-anti-sigma regulatory factor
VVTPEIEEIGEDAAVVTVGGTHIWTGEEVDDALEALKRAGRRRIVIDASEAQWLNSKVLDALVRCAADLDPREGAGLALITKHDYVKQIVEISATGGMIFLADSREEALGALP